MFSLFRLLSHMLWDYRSEAWSRLLSSLLTRALCCAYLTASINDYIDIALEACAKFSHTRQIQILDNLLAVIEVTWKCINMSVHFFNHNTVLVRRERGILSGL